MTNKFVPKNPLSYSCDKCNYNTANKKDFNKHLQTRKHKYDTNTIFTAKNLQKNPQIYECLCGKKYKHKGSLWNHKQKCNYTEKIENKKEDLQEIITKLIIDNQELQKTITELIPKIGNNTINNTINNKQKFNITVFLNEKCKDAISMNEFVDKIEVSMKNLLTTKDKGLGEGLSNIIIDNMNKLSLYERPIHCTDRKRETLYIKNDEWKKDNQKEQVNDLIRKVENKQMKNIKQWTDKHPNYMESEKLQEEYINLIRGCTSSIDGCSNKVIKKLCDKVYLTE